MDKINAAQCPYCKDVIFSRSRHDFHECSCKKTAIDGGKDYLRISFSDIKPKIFSIFIEFPFSKLFNDWNLREDKFGLIKLDYFLNDSANYSVDLSGNLHKL